MPGVMAQVSPWPPTAEEVAELARTAPPLVLAGLILLGAQFGPVGGERADAPLETLPRIATLMAESW